MAKIIVFNTNSRTLQSFTLNENDPMPYSLGRTLLVREFRGSSRSTVMWTTVQAMEAWNATRSSYNSAIPVGFAFKRIWEGGHSRTSQHYAGVAFDVGQRLSNAQRIRLHNLAVQLGVWYYVEPLSMTPTWVHFDKRYDRPAACGGSSGFPTLRQGSIGNYVLILQDALNALGFSTQTLDGRFGPNTRNALINYQRRYGLCIDGVAGCRTWNSILPKVVGIGRTPTVIDP